MTKITSKGFCWWPFTPSNWFRQVYKTRQSWNLLPALCTYNIFQRLWCLGLTSYKRWPYTNFHCSPLLVWKAVLKWPDYKQQFKIIHESHVSERIFWLSKQVPQGTLMQVLILIAVYLPYSTYPSGLCASWNIKVLLQHKNVVWEIRVIMQTPVTSKGSKERWGTTQNKVRQK